MKLKIGPSIIASDFSQLKRNLKRAERSGVDFIHVDIMDGLFVRNITFGPMIVKTIGELTFLPLHVHLMIVEPLRYIREFSEIKGVHLLSFHYEATDSVLKTIREIKKYRKMAGIAINPETPWEYIKRFLREVDEVLVMSVHPGFSGQKFIPHILNKIKGLREYKDKKNLNFKIAVDGGLNRETIPLVLKEGAEVLCIGSFFFMDKTSSRFLNSIRND